MEFDIFRQVDSFYHNIGGPASMPNTISAGRKPRQDEQVNKKTLLYLFVEIYLWFLKLKLWNWVHSGVGMSKSMFVYGYEMVSNDW